MSDESRRRLTRFVDGIDHDPRNVEQAPVEFSVLGMMREPWTVRDVLAIGRGRRHAGAQPGARYRIGP